MSYVIAGGMGLHRVFSSESDAAHGDDCEDTHLKIPQVHHIMTQPSHSTEAT